MCQDTNFTEPSDDVTKLSEASLVYNWQYVSFVRRNNTTLDLIVRSETDMMTLINVVQQYLYHPAIQGRMRLYELLRMKMKIGYESMLRHLTPIGLFQQAIMLTLVDKI